MPYSFNQEKYKLIRKLDCSLSQEEAETAVRQNSAAMNYFLSTRKLLVDTGDDPLVDSWAFEEGMPVRGCDEPNAIAVLPYCHIGITAPARPVEDAQI
jgi:hypothetical protein